MDHIMRSNPTNRSRIVVKATISEDLSGKGDPNVAKLQYLQKRNEKLYGLLTRHDIALSARSQQQNHSLSQDTGHEVLSSTASVHQQPSTRTTNHVSTTVWYCCTCSFGPCNDSIDYNCPDCQRPRCSTCMTSRISTTIDNYNYSNDCKEY